MFSGWALSFEPRIRFWAVEPDDGAAVASALAEPTYTQAPPSTSSNAAAAMVIRGRISELSGSPW